jgi:Holliday junction DNA helicase RuvA
MISFLEGTLFEKTPTRAIIVVNGIGYEILVPLSTSDKLPSTGSTCRLLISESIREDQYTLIGFLSEEERYTYNQLLNVSGIGPKIALSVLSGLSVAELITAIAAADSKRLSSISGIGKKLAERIIVELKDKFASALANQKTALHPAQTSTTVSATINDAVQALIALGYKPADAYKMVSSVPQKESLNIEELVRLALRR